MSPVAPCAAAITSRASYREPQVLVCNSRYIRHYIILAKAHQSLEEGVGLIPVMAAARMDSAHGTKTVRLQRKKSGLDFSVKGGQEHGIPIVVSWIKEGGAAGE